MRRLIFAFAASVFACGYGARECEERDAANIATKQIAWGKPVPSCETACREFERDDVVACEMLEEDGGVEGGAGGYGRSTTVRYYCEYAHAPGACRRE